MYLYIYILYIHIYTEWFSRLVMVKNFTGTSASWSQWSLKAVSGNSPIDLVVVVVQHGNSISQCSGLSCRKMWSAKILRFNTNLSKSQCSQIPEYNFVGSCPATSRFTWGNPCMVYTFLGSQLWFVAAICSKIWWIAVLQKLVDCWGTVWA